MARFYPLGDIPPRVIKDVCKRLGIPLDTKDLGATSRIAHTSLRAISTGVRLPPRKGQWYLSGAEIAAYYAGADLDTHYLLAEIVEIETITVTRIKKR